MILYTTETIYHYTCEECNNWWSYATVDGYMPDVLTCPHCDTVGVVKDNNLNEKE